MNTLTIVRHGETIENTLDILQGQQPGTLSEKGFAQARRLAERLKDERFHHIYTSDLSRALITAEIVARYHPSTPFTVTPFLRERYFGSHEGISNWRARKDEIKKRNPFDGETKTAVTARAKQFLDELERDHTDAHLLLVGHYFINLRLCSAAMNAPIEELQKAPHAGNTSVTTLRVGRDRYEILTYNCTRHLD